MGAVILKKGGGQKISGATSKTPFSCKVALLMRCEKLFVDTMMIFPVCKRFFCELLSIYASERPQNTVNTDYLWIRS